MSQDDIFINGELLRLRRESRGWTLNDMATRACMSVKQIRQIEEGGMSSFYSTAVKLTAGKKVGALLGLSVEEVFTQTVEPMTASDDNAMDALLAQTVDAAESLVDHPHVEPVSPEPVSEEQQVEEPIKPAATPEEEKAASVGEAPKSKMSLWLIAAVLGIAWAGSSYWKPQDEPVTEPVPPLQVLPAEEPSSSASAADGTASAAAEAAVVPSSMPASATPVLAPKPVASAAAPASASVVRSANASAALPAASSASKAP
jgi:cytoskeleton protein RodZ